MTAHPIRNRHQAGHKPSPSVRRPPHNGTYASSDEHAIMPGMRSRWLLALGSGVGLAMVVTGIFTNDRPFQRSGGWIAAAGLTIIVLTTIVVLVRAAPPEVHKVGRKRDWLVPVVGIAVTLFVVLVVLGVLALIFTGAMSA
jgi:uncharacterized membrane protein